MKLRPFGDWVESYRNGFGRRPGAGETGPIVLRIADVSSGQISLSSPRRGAVSAREAETYQLQVGDLLFVRVNGAREIVGRCCVVGPEVPADTIFNDHLIRARLREGLDPQFARLCLGLPAARAVIEEAAATSAGQLTIGQQTLNAIEIPDLALSDQRRIARELKAQLAVVEEARRAAQAQVEDAALLTGAILRDAFAALEEVPREPIGRIARTCSGTTPSRSRPDYWAPAVYPWIKTGEVANAPIRTSEEAISARALHECSLSLLPPGTVLVAMYGQGKTRGQSAVLEVAATTNQACFAILPGERLIPQYLQFWLRHSYQALRSLSEGRGGNQANLNGEMLNAFEVPLPALDEQRRIAAHLSAAIAAAEDACAQIAAHQKAIELLPARLLAQAFQQEEPELCC